MSSSRLPLHLSPRPLRSLRARLVAPAAWVLVFVLAFTVVGVITGGFTATRAWMGGPELVTEVPSCGDFCGTDAGLLVATP